MRIKDFFNKLFVKKKVAQKPLSSFRGECEMCFKQIKEYEAYGCKYCSFWHCLDHRLPEDHQCMGKPSNPHYT